MKIRHGNLADVGRTLFRPFAFVGVLVPKKRQAEVKEGGAE